LSSALSRIRHKWVQVRPPLTRFCHAGRTSGRCSRDAVLSGSALSRATPFGLQPGATTGRLAQNLMGWNAAMCVTAVKTDAANTGCLMVTSWGRHRGTREECA
jgi:hypothetical protein